VNELSITVTRDRTAFQPGEEIEVRAEWRLNPTPDRVELRLVWYTEGKGDRDWKLVDSHTFDRPRAYDAQTCRIPLPDSPYSFSGKLISLVWALELVVKPHGNSRRLEITIGPGGKEVLLGSGASWDD